MKSQEQTRLDRIADRVRNFKIAISGGGDLIGGFSPIPERGATLGHIQKAFADFKLVGHNGIQAHGSLKEGYVLFGAPETGVTEGFPEPIPPPPVDLTGACCEGEDCSITLEEDCEGEFQGVGTDCDPNPCVDTGACCVGESCSIETEEDCEGGGGIYHGNGTDCDPNPCVEEPFGACCADGDCFDDTASNCAEYGVYFGDGSVCDESGYDARCCPCGFAAFDGSGGKYMRYQRTISGTVSQDTTNSCEPPDDLHFQTEAEVSASYEAHYVVDPEAFGGCSHVVDSDTSSSSHSQTINGVVNTDADCERDDVQCFCSTFPPFNECAGSFYGSDTNCGGDCTGPYPSDVDETATTRTTTVDFTASCEIECVACDDCTLNCEVSGSYTVTEILSEQCVVEP